MISLILAVIVAQATPQPKPTMQFVLCYGDNKNPACHVANLHPTRDKCFRLMEKAYEHSQTELEDTITAAKEAQQGQDYSAALQRVENDVEQMDSYYKQAEWCEYDR